VAENGMFAWYFLGFMCPIFSYSFINLWYFNLSSGFWHSAFYAYSLCSAERREDPSSSGSIFVGILTTNLPLFWTVLEIMSCSHDCYSVVMENFSTSSTSLKQLILCTRLVSSRSNICVIILCDVMNGAVPNSVHSNTISWSTGWPRRIRQPDRSIS